MAASSGKLKQPNQSAKPTISKEKVLECIKAQRELMGGFMEQMALMRGKAQNPSNEMETMIEMMVMQAKMGDEMFERTGVEEDEL